MNELKTEAGNVKSSRKWDPNLPQEKVDAINEAAKTDDQEKGVNLDKSELQDSPYESVRAAVRNTDNGEAANTVRAWVLGMIFVTIGSGLNMFLSMRNPSIAIPAIVIQLLSYPIGCLWARIMPTRTFNTFGLQWTLNTGPFTIKEHSVITIMAKYQY
ncbi:oligopeptide transporter [Aspergillus sclerotialis]|uniref:Oligopeptide transporter n=1 Tax=Aspergillus sclerotialis TaxID=2070753 RepID=A0A3A2ZJT1_9EURO|nr:oligopeptide transporter [Aspergillus sclerotialis]